MLDSAWGRAWIPEEPVTGEPMRNEFTAVYEHDGTGSLRTVLRLPEPTGRGTQRMRRASLADAIVLILEDRRDEGVSVTHW